MIDNMDNKDNKELIEIDVNKNDNIVLPTAQADALELLMQGVAVKDVASQVGVSERTIYRWMTKPQFSNALKKSKEVVIDTLSALATERLKEMLVEGGVYSQQFAISQLVKMQKDVIKVEIQKEKEYNSLEDLMADFNKK